MGAVANNIFDRRAIIRQISLQFIKWRSQFVQLDLLFDRKVDQLCFIGIRQFRLSSFSLMRQKHWQVCLLDH